MSHLVFGSCDEYIRHRSWDIPTSDLHSWRDLRFARFKRAENCCGGTTMAGPTQVVVSSESGLAQEIASGNHRWRADEPAPFGTDTGPSPYELLLAALGACTSMTMRLYAQRKEWDLRRVTVRVQHFRIHAEDCMECETKEGFVDRIDREIELTGN